MAPRSKRPSLTKERETDVTFDESISDSEIHTFTLRVQKHVIDQLDEIVSKHPVFRNRNTWIVNAIVEQLKRERHG